MANGHENLIPFNELTEEEHREIASKGGKASVIARRKKKAMKEQVELLLSLPLVDTDAIARFKELGIDDENIDNQMAMVLAQWQKALGGDTSAFNAIRELTGERVQEIKVNQVTDSKVAELEAYLNAKE